jgi:hypothetical protein
MRDHTIKGDIMISHVRTNEQLANIFTKPLDERRFWELRSELNIIHSLECGLIHCTSNCLDVMLWNKMNFKTLHASYCEINCFFLINGSSCSYHGRFYVMFVWRPWPLYISIYIYPWSQNNPNLEFKIIWKTLKSTESGRTETIQRTMSKPLG